MGAPDKIKSLVESFSRNIDDYKSGKKNETELRREFLDPFFTELGWDVANDKTYADAYKDVVHEYSIKTKKGNEFPDYCFRIGQTPKFFVEAKQPSVNVKDDVNPALQVRGYAWSAKLPLSILTDFEEFAVYDCRITPNKNDKASVARIMLLTYDEYIDRWDEIESVFSREAILKGSFDRYIESSKKKKGTAEVDEVFLNQMEEWRKSLAKNIALRNPQLSIRELNYAVQKTIDRIIFLRICEDRGIEEYGQLLSLQKSNSVYAGLKQIFHRADEKYNSGLFHFEKEKDRTEQPDNITLNLTVDDKTLKEIIKELYYPESSFKFSVIPADILGQVYEQFLGKVIRLTAGHQAIIDDKPEVKKAGGVYYTPTYIVDYIVNNTVGRLISPLSQRGDQGGFQNPKQVNTLKILDPACGSGSFLLGAYQYLLDWHLNYYTIELGTNDKLLKQKQPPVYINEKGNYLLTTSEKKRILLNNIYGVDIDPQAVEVTKLSLMLKVLEGESTQTLNNELKFFRERALPDLSNNIKCGNSLIGPDFYDQMEMNFIDEEEKLRINVFNWNKEFPQVFNTSLSFKRRGNEGEVENAGGFDVVIGNPPWGALFNNLEKDYLKNRFNEFHVRTPESFNYFIANSIRVRNDQGIIGIIIPSSFLNQFEFWKTRKMIVENLKFSKICNLGDGVFKKVSAPSCVLIFGKDISSTSYLDLRTSDRALLSQLINNEINSKISSNIGLDSDDFILQPRNNIEIIKKCNRWPTLKSIAEDVATGISSGLDQAYVYKAEQIKELQLEQELLKKLVIGGEVGRYWIKPESGKRIIYITSENNITDYPNIHSALLPHREKLKKRREAANGSISWYALNWPRRQKLFEKPKILIRQTADHIMSIIDTGGWYCLKSVIIVQLNESEKMSYEYLLALLNSKLFKYLYYDLVGEQSRIFPEVKPVQLFKLPIRILDFDSIKDKELHNEIKILVDQIIRLNISVTVSKTPTERTAIERQIQATDNQIDQLVYQLYGLTPEEIKIVESK